MRTTRLLSSGNKLVRMIGTLDANSIMASSVNRRTSKAEHMTATQAAQCIITPTNSLQSGCRPHMTFIGGGAEIVLWPELSPPVIPAQAGTHGKFQLAWFETRSAGSK